MPNAIITYADPVLVHGVLCELSRNGYGGHEVLHAQNEQHLARIIKTTKAKNFIAVLEQQPTKAVTVLRLELEFNAIVYHDPIPRPENVQGERVTDQ